MSSPGSAIKRPAKRVNHAGSISWKTLRKRIYVEYPQLREPATSDFERVTLLRQWAWSHVRVGSPSNLLDKNPDIDWYKLDAAAIFALFAKESGGVYCGGAALALQRLYEGFGYDAWSINNGEPSIKVSHVSTLVQIQVGPRQLICLQDPLFNITYVDATTGLPLDYYDLLERLRRREHQSVRVLESDHRQIRSRPAWIVSAKDIAGRRPEQIYTDTLQNMLEPDYRLEKLADGSMKFIGARTLEQFQRCCQIPKSAPASYLAWLTQQGHPGQLPYLYLYPLGISGPDGDVFLRRAKSRRKSYRRLQWRANTQKFKPLDGARWHFPNRRR